MQTYQIEVMHGDPSDQDVYFTDYQIQATSEYEDEALAVNICQAEHPDTYIHQIEVKAIIENIVPFTPDLTEAEWKAHNDQMRHEYSNFDLNYTERLYGGSVR